jgi:uncharacterized protein
MAAIVVNFVAAKSRVLPRCAVLMLLALVLLSQTGCAWWSTQQRQWGFRPTPGQAPPGFKGLREGDQKYFVAVPGTDERISLWWLPHAQAQAPTVLYLHGTFRNLYRNLPKIEALREAGFSVLAVDYRGWGQSSPIVPSEETIYQDAELAWGELLRYQPNPAQRVLFGHSMGGGVAIELAHKRRHGRDYGALVIESTFTRWPDMAASVGVLGRVLSWFLIDRFDSVAKIGQVDAPLFIMHGRLDNTVPVRMAQRLRDAAPPGVRYAEFPEGSHSRLHSDDPVAYQALWQEVKTRLTQASITQASAPLAAASAASSAQ